MEAITSSLRKSAEGSKPFGAVIKFDAGDAGVVCIDGRGEEVVVDNVDHDAKTTIVLSRDNLEKLLKGKLNPAMAFMSGKIKVQGDVSLAMKLATFL